MEPPIKEDYMPLQAPENPVQSPSQPAPAPQFTPQEPVSQPSAPVSGSEPMRGEPNQADSALGGQQTGQIQPSAGPSVLDALKNQGYDTSGFNSEADFVQYLNQVQQYLPQIERLAGYGQQMLPYAKEWETFLAQQRASAGQPAAQPGPQQAAAPEEPSWWPKAPEWKPEWERYLAVDANGNVVVRDPSVTSPTLVQKYHEHQNWRRERLEALLSNPLEAVKPGLEKMIQEMAAKQTQEALTEHRNQQFANSWAMANQELFFTQSPSGQQQLTQVGQAVLQNIQQLEQLGVTDTVAQAQLAQQLAYAQLGPQAFQPQSAGQQVQQPQVQQPQVQQQLLGPDPKERFLKGNGFSPNRSNTISQAALPHVPQNPGASYRDQLRQNAKNRGLIHDE